MDEQTMNLLKWLLIGAASGYVPLGGFIIYLVRELLKAKDENTRIMLKATMYNKETNSTLDKVSCAIDKIVEFLR